VGGPAGGPAQALGSPRLAQRACCSGPAAAFAAAPSHIPSDPLLGQTTPRPLPGPLLTFRKIHLYGKTKKSTHGHTTATPIRPHPWRLAQGGNQGRRTQPAHFPAPPGPRWPCARVVQGRSMGLQGSTINRLPCSIRPTLHLPQAGRPALGLSRAPGAAPRHAGGTSRRREGPGAPALPCFPPFSPFQPFPPPSRRFRLVFTWNPW
jgi:hypothetical protein